MIVLFLQNVYSFVIENELYCLSWVSFIFGTSAAFFLFKNWLSALFLYFVVACGIFYVPNYSFFMKIFMFYALISYVYKEYFITLHYNNNGEFVAWDKLEGNQGDIVEFRRYSLGYSWGYAHWGIYDGKRIIHLVNLKNGTGVVKSQLLETVANNGLCRINNLEKLANMKNLVKKDEDEIMEIALKRIHEKIAYDQIYYNCEHFVTECIYGIPFSSQTEIKRSAWEEEFLNQYIKLLFIYMSIVYLWRWQYIREIIERTVHCIISALHLNSFVYNSESFSNWLDENRNYVITIAVVSPSIIYLAIELILYLIK